mgnify:CR=1 FL=1
MNSTFSSASPPEIVSSVTICRSASLICWHRLFLFCFLALPMAVTAAPVKAGDVEAQANLQEWQLRRLNQPTERERAQELSGGIYIYDGLNDKQVDQALDKHFDRIENMMFMGTIKTSPSGDVLRDGEGKVVTESGGCF